MDKPKLCLVFEISDVQKQLLELVPKELVKVDKVPLFKAIEYVREHQPQIIIVPMTENGYKGKLFEDLKECNPKSRIILICTGSEAAEAFELVMENQVYDYFILKPILEPKRLTVSIVKAVEQLSLLPTQKSNSDIPPQKFVELKQLYYQTQTSIQDSLNQSIPKLREQIYNLSGFLQSDFKSSLEIIYGDALQERFEYFKQQNLTSIMTELQTSLAQFDGVAQEEIEKKFTGFKQQFAAQLDLLQLETHSILETIDQENIDSSFEHYRLQGINPTIGNHHRELSENINEIMRSLNTYFKQSQSSGIQQRSEVIAVIDDSRYDAELMEALLKKLGFHVRIGMNGQEGIMIAQQEKPNLMIVDATMPKMNGYEVIKHLKGNPQTASIPIMFMSGGTSQEAVQKLLQEEQIIYFISKPYKLKEISQMILKHFGEEISE